MKITYFKLLELIKDKKQPIMVAYQDDIWKWENHSYVRYESGEKKYLSDEVVGIEFDNNLVGKKIIGIIEEQTCEWISCSESLPKERKRVLVCLNAPINQICVSQRVDTNYWIGLGRVNVVAWMELPKAYEVEEE